MCSCVKTRCHPNSDTDIGKSFIFPSVAFTNNTLAECVAQLNADAVKLYEGEGAPPEIIIDFKPADIVLEGIVEENLPATLKIKEYYSNHFNKWRDFASTNKITITARWIPLYDVFKLLADISNACATCVDNKRFLIKAEGTELFLREYRSEDWKWHVEDRLSPITGLCTPYKSFIFIFDDKPLNFFVPETNSMLVLGTEAEHQKFLKATDGLLTIEKNE